MADCLFLHLYAVGLTQRGLFAIGLGILVPSLDRGPYFVMFWIYNFSILRWCTYLLLFLQCDSVVSVCDQGSYLVIPMSRLEDA